jgi:hypothetical protein
MTHHDDLAELRALNKRFIHNFVTNDVVTYLRVGNRWLCVQAQLTPVAEPNYPPDSSIVVQYRNGRLV